MRTCLATIAAMGLAAGCGRSTGFEDIGGLGGGPLTSGGRSGGSGGHSTGIATGATGIAGTIGSGSGTPNGTAASGTGTGTGGQSAGSNGSGTGRTSGGTGGVCGLGSATEFQPCISTSDCVCPLGCIPEPGGSLCERPCQSLNDCPSLETTCAAGFCRLNFCGPQGVGPTNGKLDGKCNVVGTDDGSCIPQTLNGQNVGLCSQGGPAAANCDPAATRADLVNACLPGDFCLFEPGGGQCFLLCDPFEKLSPCPGQMTCVKPLESNSRLGICEPLGSTGGSGTAGGTGGTTGGRTDCNPKVESLEFQNCDSAECGCPFTCVPDAVSGGKVCENVCQTLDDCTDPATICIPGLGGIPDSGVCGLVGCGPGTGNGSFNSTCSIFSSGDGTCAPVTFDGVNSVGLCSLAGTATSDCDPNPLRSDPPSLLCVPGSLCFGGFGHSDGTCNQLCDPSQGTGCPPAQFCSGIVDEPDLGVCISF